jgi:hypothetical protein
MHKCAVRHGNLTGEQPIRDSDLDFFFMWSATICMELLVMHDFGRRIFVQTKSYLTFAIRKMYRYLSSNSSMNLQIIPLLNLGRIGYLSKVR